ncbi:hypothetical protein FOS14_06655 [Skermania sp. ID1734]|uniref:hypothetical protein n=1 Tax=Skermania sp. ID1734 TaxID=2597516 RepID=UPI00117C9BD3|nr:hypothetical protein [Skermania sp. ID1734]TSE00699.1 hypothetical protein FOS14_06655 [Skermania sp. ID1734]
MTAAERRALILRLERPLDEILSPRVLGRARWTRLGLMIGGAVGMIPWIVFLSLTLPADYEAHNWPATWVGFDLFMVILMASTAVLGLLRRQLMLLTAFATGVLLICDAWFDIMTAGPDDVWISVATAVFAELPLAVVLIAGTLRIVRLTAARLWLLDPGAPLWRLPLLP